MDTNFITPVLNSVTHVFSLLVNTEVEIGQLQIKDKDELRVNHSISGHMNLNSNNASASITIAFPEDVILNIANHIMPETAPELNDVVIDLVGEITNMVSGGVKGALESAGYLFELSLPTITLEREHFLPYGQKEPIILVELYTEFGGFTVETSFSGSPDFCPLQIESMDDFDDILF